MGVILFEINPFLAFVQRFVPRVLDGFLLGFVFKFFNKKTNAYAACTVTGFCSALFNTVLFMSALIILFGNTEYMRQLMGEKNVIVFVCSFVGINAVVEMAASAIITGAVGSALYKAKLIPSQSSQPVG